MKTTNTIHIYLTNQELVQIYEALKVGDGIAYTSRPKLVRMFILSALKSLEAQKLVQPRDEKNPTLQVDAARRIEAIEGKADPMLSLPEGLPPELRQTIEDNDRDTAMIGEFRHHLAAHRPSDPFNAEDEEAEDGF